MTWKGTTPGESLCPVMELLQGSPSVLGWNECRGVIQSKDRTTLEESFSPEMERHQVRPLVLGC